MEKYTLVGVDGNAYAVIGYVCNALKESGLKELKEEFIAKATSGNYDNLLAVSMDYIDKANHVNKK